jgi:DNA-nicking Smr family endonuclease
MEPVKNRSSKLPTTDSPDAAADDDAFAMAMRDVVRLEPDPRGHVRNVVPISPPRHSPQRTEHADVSDNDDFVAHGVDRREIRKLKKGEYLVRDRRDLHGMTGADAVASVGRFIDNSRYRGHRCVCIIHGRGLHSKGNPPVLKTRVREYLRSHRSVLAYTDAPVSDGGSGAVYVLLRK